MNPQGISLHQLNKQIKLQLQGAFPNQMWIIAEISELRENRTGHCYLELIEKDESSDQIIAKARATIWAYTYRMIKPFFQTTTGQDLKPGIKVLIKVSVEYQELYGLSLNIKDIDPSYTLGDIARRRNEILKKLDNEGVLDMNKELEMPVLPKTIAIISSPTAAGYEDFTHQLETNSQEFAFHCKLFPAIMQGAQAEASIIDALDRIYQYEDIFDIVVIIRGGGSHSDLNCFDSYWLAYHITQFPIPVIAGIGHERDQTIVDIVSHTRVKTPTAAAEYIIDCFSQFKNYTHDLEEKFFTGVDDIIYSAKENLSNLSRQFSPWVQGVIQSHKSSLSLLEQQLITQSHKYISGQTNILNQIRSTLNYTLSNRIAREQTNLERIELQHKNACRALINNNYHKLQLFSQTIKYVNPQNILKKGYSLTLMNGKIVKDISQLDINNIIETQLANGKVLSKVIEMDEDAQ